MSLYRWAQVFWDLAASAFTMIVARLLPNLRISPVDLTGKTAIVTGATSGVGKSLTFSLAESKATVYLACRNTKQAQEVASQIIDSCGEDCAKRVHVLALDTSSLASVRAFAAAWSSRTIDILIHNAGIAALPSNGLRTTDEGLETIYATNFAGSFLLTSLLEPCLAPTARVVFTSSIGQYAADYKHILRIPGMVPSSITAIEAQIPESGLYADSKFMQIVFARLLQRRFDAQAGRRTAHAFSPGYTNTNIFDKSPDVKWSVDLPLYFLKAARVLCVPVEQGAATGLWLATTGDPRVIGEGNGGEYWDRCVRRRTMLNILSEEAVGEMWQCWERDTKASWN